MTFNANKTGTHHTSGSDDAIDFTWKLENGVLIMTNSNTQVIWSMCLLAVTSDSSHYTVSLVKPDDAGGVSRLIDTFIRFYFR